MGEWILTLVNISGTNWFLPSLLMSVGFNFFSGWHAARHCPSSSDPNKLCHSHPACFFQEGLCTLSHLSPYYHPLYYAAKWIMEINNCATWIVGNVQIHWASKETYHFLRVTHIKIQSIKMNHNWPQISSDTPYQAHLKKNTFAWVKKE